MNEEESQEKKKRARKNINKGAKRTRFGKINVGKYFTYDTNNISSNDKVYPTYSNITVKGKVRNAPVYKICNVCFGFANYTCPLCADRYCSKQCYKSHREVKCVKYLEL